MAEVHDARTSTTSYTFGDTEKAELGAISYASCEIIFVGIETVVESSVAFTENVANKMMNAKIEEIGNILS